MTGFQVLLAKGRLRLVMGTRRNYLRFEVITNDPTELRMLQRAYGGITTQHNPYTQRWAVQAEDDLLRVGSSLYNRGCPLACRVLTYLSLRAGEERWEYVRNLESLLGKRCIKLSEWS